MKNWNFKVKSSISEIIKKLETTLGSAAGFVLNIDNSKNDSVAFKVRKRGLYAFQIMFVNKINVNGKILRTDSENMTNIEITFTQYFLWKLIILTHLFLGLGFLIAILSGTSDNAYMYILGGILLAFGIVLWITVQRKFNRDIQEYKALITKILEP